MFFCFYETYNKNYLKEGEKIMKEINETKEVKVEVIEDGIISAEEANFCIAFCSPVITAF
jgi:hypothetical protein